MQRLACTDHYSVGDPLGLKYLQLHPLKSCKASTTSSQQVNPSGWSPCTRISPSSCKVLAAIRHCSRVYSKSCKVHPVIQLFLHALITSV